MTVFFLSGAASEIITNRQHEVTERWRIERTFDTVSSRATGPPCRPPTGWL